MPMFELERMWKDRSPDVQPTPRPAVGVAYLHSSVDLGDLIGDSAGGCEIALQARAPILIQPADHFFMGVGPVVRTDLVSKVEGEDSNKITAIGFQSTVGGYW